MRRILLLFTAMAVIFSASAQTTGIQNYIQTNGVGEVEITPNEFTLSITIDEKATKGRYSVDDVESKMRSALKRLKIDSDALTMNSLSSQREKRQSAMTRADYELKLSSASQIEECYDVLNELGITQISITEATHTDIETYKDEARTKAVADAVGRAKKLGEALGQGVGECFQISDNSFYIENSRPNIVMRGVYASNAADSAASNSEIEYRSIKINYSVKAKFLLVVSSDFKREMVK